MAARLLANGKIDKFDYAVLALSVVAELEGNPLRREDGFHALTFSLNAGFALGATMQTLNTFDIGPYGPIEKAIYWLGERFPVVTGSGDTFNVQDLRFLWGDGADALLRRAKIRLSAINRAYERFDAWRGYQARLAPHLHDDVWKLLIALVAAGVGFAMGRVTAP